jgi:hypothetical protein
MTTASLLGVINPYLLPQIDANVELLPTARGEFIAKLTQILQEKSAEPSAAGATTSPSMTADFTLIRYASCSNLQNPHYALPVILEYEHSAIK